MRIDAIGGDAGDDRAGAVEVGRPPAEVACFDGSAGGVVFGIRPDDEDFRTSILVEIDVTRLRLTLDLREPVTRL